MNTTIFRVCAFALLVGGGRCSVQAAAVLDGPSPVAAQPYNRIAVSASGESSAPILSTDGRVIVFTSSADNLVSSNDLNHSLDVFAFDLQTRTLSLVSVEATGSRSANGRSTALDMSATGQIVLFESDASDLVAGDTNGAPDLYVRDLTDGRTVPISVDSSGTLIGQQGFHRAALSRNGKVVVFETLAALSPSDTNRAADVYACDIERREFKLLNVNSNGVVGDRLSTNAVVSADGRCVAFLSHAVNLFSSDFNNSPEAVVRDTWSNVTTLVSSTKDGRPGGQCSDVAISATGRFVAFLSGNTTLSTNSTLGASSPLLYVRDTLAGTTTWVSRLTEQNTVANPTISPDELSVAYESAVNVYVWSRTSMSTYMVTTNAYGSGGGSDVSFAPEFSADGRYLTFLSYATNLLPGLSERSIGRAYLRDMQTGKTILIGGPDVPERTGSTGNTSISSDGGIIAFDSVHGALVAGDYNQASDVFFYNTSTGSIELVSRRTPKQPSTTAAARSGVSPRCLSADGRYLLYSRSDYRPSPGAATALWVSDLATGETQMVTVASDGSPAPGIFLNSELSADGSQVVFESNSTNLVSNDTNRAADIFLFDRKTRSTTRMSAPWEPGASANGYSVTPSISSNGQFVLFQSIASNLTSNDANGLTDVFIRDVLNGTNMALSINPATGQCLGGQTQSGFGFENPRRSLLTPDGGWAVLWSSLNLYPDPLPGFGSLGLFAVELQTRKVIPITYNTNGAVYPVLPRLTLSPGGSFLAFTLSGADVSLFEFQTRTAGFLIRNALNPTLSADGKWVAFESYAVLHGFPDGNLHTDVLLLNRGDGSIQMVSRAFDGATGGNGDSSCSSLSADGRYVLFRSSASNLVEGDDNDLPDVFVRDLTTGKTHALTAALQGQLGDSVCGVPHFGADGRTVVFESLARNLTAHDRNEMRDVFVVKLGYGDSDGDELDDGWEVTYFGNLERSGMLDADFDGATDYEEFKAGTSPIADNSVLRAWTTVQPTAEGVVVSWDSVPGKTYFVEWKDDLAQSVWNGVAHEVTATALHCSVVDSEGSAGLARFYRVRVLP